MSACSSVCVGVCYSSCIYFFMWVLFDEGISVCKCACYCIFKWVLHLYSVFISTYKNNLVHLCEQVFKIFGHCI